MAETVHLYLKLNGVDIEGESSQTSLGREDSIEIVSWTWDVETARSSGAAGRPVMGEVRYVQRIDKSTPLLFKGLTNNEVAEGVFKFFRPNPTGDGTTQQFFTFEGKQGRITSVNPWVADVINPATATLPPLLQLTMLFPRVIQTYEDGGITHDWDSSGGSA
jgi:type VI secretion system secreted protein Hcp